MAMLGAEFDGWRVVRAAAAARVGVLVPSPKGGVSRFVTPN
jgi:hypothetical protein